MDEKTKHLTENVSRPEPLVSVVMSVYNGEKYVEDAIKSILNQTYKNWELIIIDDGSSDSTKQVINRFKDDRIKYLYHQNMGLTKSLNRGIEKSVGKYIARIDADDRALPSRLEKQVVFLESNQEYVLVSSFCYSIDMSCMRVLVTKPPINDRDCRKKLKSGSSTFMHSSVMFRRKIAQEIVKYDEKFKQAQDYRLWISLASRGKIASLAEPLCLALRNDPSSITSKRSPLNHFFLVLSLSWLAFRELNGSVMDFLGAVLNAIKNLIIAYILKIQAVKLVKQRLRSQRYQYIAFTDIIRLWRNDISC
jgi:glycosyltransferase involved in cell wall biosynthesis